MRPMIMPRARTSIAPTRGDDQLCMRDMNRRARRLSNQAARTLDQRAVRPELLTATLAGDDFARDPADQPGADQSQPGEAGEQAGK